MNYSLFYSMLCRNAAFALVGSALFLIVGNVEAGTYTGSAHYTSVKRSFDSNYDSYATGNCSHCHEQHTSLKGVEPSPPSTDYGPNGALLFSPESKLCIECHDTGGPAVKNVNIQIIKTYSHPTTTIDNKHTTSKLEKGQSGLPFRGALRHAECADCHNPHVAKNPGRAVNVSLHIRPSPGGTGANNNTIAQANPNSVLLGVWGVEPSNTSDPTWGTANVSYTEYDPATKEYQICFKCHSYYGLGADAANGVSSIVGPSGALITDQAMEFSKDNRGMHPVRFGLSAAVASGGAGALSAAWMVPWGSGGLVGNQTMYCSDCHGANNEVRAGGGARGPHGSTKLFMLKMTGAPTGNGKHYWPFSSIGTPWSLNDISGSDASVGGPIKNTWTMVKNELYCLNCHYVFGNPPSQTPANWNNNPTSGTYNTAHKATWAAGTKAHYNQGYNPDGTANTHNTYCTACHTALPHGTKRSRLIVYASENAGGAPYTATYSGLNLAALSGFKLPGASAPYTFTISSCYSTVTGCSAHTDAGGYQGDATP